MSCSLRLSFKFGTNKMKSSLIYVMLLSALVVQISSETTDLDKILNSIVSSTIELAVKPIKDLINMTPMNTDAEQFLKEFSTKIKRLMEQSQEELFNMIPKGERENQKKLIGYLSMYMSGAFSDAKRLTSTLTNKSVDALPDNIKTKLFGIGNDINDFLKKLNADMNSMNGSKAS